MERGITSPATQTAGEYGCQTSPATQTATAAESLARELRERLIRALCGEPAFDQAQGDRPRAVLPASTALAAAVAAGCLWPAATEPVRSRAARPGTGKRPARRERPCRAIRDGWIRPAWGTRVKDAGSASAARASRQPGGADQAAAAACLARTICPSRCRRSCRRPHVMVGANVGPGGDHRPGLSGSRCGSGLAGRVKGRRWLTG
jgi:hypothetical protein